MLTEEYIFKALEAERSGVQFPIDLDDVWEGIGYARKDSAVRKLTKSRLKLGVDYTLHTSVGTRQGGTYDKYFLTVEAYKSYCLSTNTDEGENTRRYFIRIEQKYRAYLEQLFRSTPDTEKMALIAHIAELKTRLKVAEAIAFGNTHNQTDPDAPNAPQNPFPYTWEILWKDSGMVSKYQVRDAILRDFIEGVHYRWNEKVLEISTICYQILMINFRPDQKADISKLPRLLQMDRDELFAYSARKATKNGRNGKADAVDHPTIPGFPLQ